MKNYLSFPNGQKFQTSTSIWTKFVSCHQVCAPISADKDKGLTASMVNNYVETWLPRSLTRKYQRQQIARLIANTTPHLYFHSRNNRHLILYNLKQVRPTLRCFWDHMKLRIDPVNPIIQTSCQTVKPIIKLSLIHHTEEEVIRWILVLNSADNSVLRGDC